MRAFQLTTIILTAISLTAVGCRQTTGPNNAGPLTPIGPLAPLGTGQAPSLNPFGGSTRVAPPEGSFVAPNNYMGGVVPAAPPNAAFGAQNNAPIGSGVQVATWNDANTPGVQNGQAPPPATFGSNPSSGTDPRRGGMQIIDMTNAPPPPGYQVPMTNYNNQFAPNGVPNWQQGQSWQQPTNQNFQSPLPQNPSGLQPITAPNPAIIANQLAPAPPVSSNAPGGIYPNTGAPRTAIAPMGPSTEPVTGAGAIDPTLPWRRPGARY